ncbi:unnamed protein product, partial [Ectocarpus fasciculatus]
SGTGSSGAIGREGEKETASWLWPLSSASIWDNKAWPAIGGRLRIASLDEGAEAHPDGGGKQGSGEDNRDAENKGVAEAAGSTGAGAGRGRWVWEAEPRSRVEQHQAVSPLAEAASLAHAAAPFSVETTRSVRPCRFHDKPLRGKEEDSD